MENGGTAKVAIAPEKNIMVFNQTLDL